MRTKFLAALMVSAAALVVSGCTYPTSFGPSGMSPAFIYTDNQIYPSDNTSSTQYQLTTDDFEIRGTVVATGESQNILNVISQGDNGYQSLLEEARSQGADDVMNVRVDTQYMNILFLYGKCTTILTGQGVRWN